MYGYPVDEKHMTFVEHWGEQERLFAAKILNRNLKRYLFSEDLMNDALGEIYAFILGGKVKEGAGRTPKNLSTVVYRRVMPGDLTNFINKVLPKRIHLGCFPLKKYRDKVKLNLEHSKREHIRKRTGSYEDYDRVISCHYVIDDEKILISSISRLIQNNFNKREAELIYLRLGDGNSITEIAKSEGKKRHIVKKEIQEAISKLSHVLYSKNIEACI